MQKKSPKTFRGVVKRALSDPVYFNKMRKIAITAKSGKRKDVEAFRKSFKIHQTQLKLLQSDFNKLQGSKNGKRPPVIGTWTTTVTIPLATWFFTCWDPICKKAE